MTTRRPTLLARVFDRLSKHVSGRLHSQLSRPDGMRPRWSISKSLAIALAAGVHLVTLLLIPAGILLILSGGFVYIVLGFVLIGMAILFRPRIRPIPDDAHPATTYPELANLSRHVAEAAGTFPAPLIQVTPSFNASVSHAGFPGRRILEVGLPLMAVLQPEERVAVLAHEYGHFVNGDLLRGRLVGSAVSSLVGWHSMLRPTSLFEGEEAGAVGVFMVPINLVMLGISYLPYGAAVLLVTLLFRDMQRAEYLADAVASSVAGSRATSSMLERLHLASVAERVAEASSLSHWRNQSLWDELTFRCADLPASERERARRAAHAATARLDDTHPPTTYRIRAIEARPPQGARVDTDAGAVKAIEAEIRREESRISGTVVDDYRATLHY